MGEPILAERISIAKSGIKVLKSGKKKKGNKEKEADSQL